jgi:glucokinase
MPAEPTVFLGDFGGTHLRLAIRGDQGPSQIEVYKVAEWSGIGDVLRDYALRTGTHYKDASLYLSHTGHIVDGGLTLHYKETRPWSFRLEDVRAEFALARLDAVNDLKAAAYAVLHTGVDVFEPLRTGIDDGSNALVLGLGTGIGHAYLDRRARISTETYGGHFPATTVTERQRALADIIRAGLATGRSFIAEDILSGEGLMRLYRAMAAYTKTQAQAKTVHDLIPLKDVDPLVRMSTSAFCEFLGIHANILCTAPHAYGGIYLCGGLFDRLMDADLFDFDAFTANLHQNMVPVVAHSLENAPIFAAKVEHASLYGLDVYAGAIV